MKTSSQITARPSPKRECHNCPLNGKGDDYCWKKCLGPAEKSNKGRSRVTLGGMDAPDEFIHGNADDDYMAARSAKPLPAASAPSSVTAKLNYEVERNLVEVLASFMSLSDIQLCLFRHVYNGENLAVAGRNCIRPMSRQAASKHMKAIRRSNPVIAQVMSQLVRLQDDEEENADRRNSVQTNFLDELLKRIA